MDIENENIIDDYNDAVPQDDINEEDDTMNNTNKEDEGDDHGIINFTKTLVDMSAMEKHSTTPFLTRFEKTRVIGARIQEINKGAPALVDTKGLRESKDIALKELAERKIPYIIRRPLPDGTFDDWKLAELRY